ncbi:MerR family transcriptional regulator [Streptomyces albireticuli]|uniref:MerR family transcriptional regulator n=1 Tax=Streptomyces albireticuli TaxID=1940 RepID=A0A2A2D9E6_9ACTN|nr:MerR family transcriptional regulator [Streptomyces albireticuli]MCD9144577.1 MerR family transcriptional regulator [Streptomyces albireticuli]MCD9163360.1 MerR family transcriptional regulator [Streptomyces albireticuli]MCD9193255.1 MerR family transcriptional regulator [Streptomyces albireticuli]PAU47999.1 MerR family transcriptional regulator [Streptomyces albireticuli]
MKIGELALTTGVSVRLLRYYEEQGLLASHRLPSGHRRYAADAPETVRRIRVLLAAGLPTRVIRDVLPCVRGAEATAFDPCVATYLREHLDGLDARIADLQGARTSLAGLLAATEGAAA